LIPFAIGLTACAKTPGKPGDVVHAFFTRSDIVFHDAITVQTFAPATEK
jgi:hypothetical protein